MKCITEKDNKYPSRWCPVRIYRTADCGFWKKKRSSRQLLMCVIIAMIHGLMRSEFALWVQSVTCMLLMQGFMTPVVKHLWVSSSSSSFTPEVEHDEIMDFVIREIAKDKTRIWNSINIYSLYCDHGGTLQRKTVMKKVLTDFGDQVIMLSSDGVANIVAFRKTASSQLRIVQDEDDDEDFGHRTANKIVRETNEIVRSKNEYNVEMNLDSVTSEISETLLKLLSSISLKLSSSLRAALIGNIITSTPTRHPTMLQESLSVLLRRKKLIEKFYDFGVCCSYQKFRRFRISAATAS